MTHYKIQIVSKNKKALDHFCNNFFSEKKIANNFYSDIVVLKTISKNKKLSILKAPHVYKSAQEQFEIKTFKKSLIVKTTNDFKFLKIVKVAKTQNFSNISFRVNLTSKNKTATNFFEVVNLKKFYCENNKAPSLKTRIFKKIRHKSNYTFLKKYMTYLDFYGNFAL